jgi:hypothetical protein
MDFEILAHETFDACIESRKREGKCSHRRKSDAVSRQLMSMVGRSTARPSKNKRIRGMRHVG